MLTATSPSQFTSIFLRKLWSFLLICKSWVFKESINIWCRHSRHFTKSGLHHVSRFSLCLRKDTFSTSKNATFSFNLTFYFLSENLLIIIYEENQELLCEAIFLITWSQILQVHNLRQFQITLNKFWFITYHLLN